ncbi:MAG: hypothetical protein ACHP7P_04720 [Terriglobales bacterium]
MKRRLSLVLAAVLAFGLVSLAAAQQQDQSNKPAPDPLVQLLQNKGVLTAQEATAINQAATPAEQQSRLTQLLYSKGLITQEEYKTAEASGVSESNGTWLPAAAHVSAGEPGPAMAMPPQAPVAPAIIPGVAPVRVLTNDPPKAGGMVPDLKLGSGAKVKFYGFIKSTAAEDSSNPYNIDFVLPGLGGTVNGALPTSVPMGLTSPFTGGLAGVGDADSGPNGSPSFYLKGSATRMGANFEWPDIAGANNALTGRIETDFEGNFSRAQNRNVSSIRTRMLSLRLAWARIDHKFSEDTTGFILFGMDWTPFGSSTVPNLLETTENGAFFGALYEREAQIRFGLWHDFGGSHNFKIGIEPAIGMPGFGNNSTDVGTQIGVSERDGADSARPEISGRVVFQWQLDKARGVAPAQIIFSGMNAKRVEIVNRAAIAAADCGASGVAGTGCVAGEVTSLLAAFPHGAEPSSQRWGATGEFQLPTRYATLVGKYYTGADLKYYFGGQAFSVFNDNRIGLQNAPGAIGTGGVVMCNINPANCPNAFNIDAEAPNAAFGWNPALGAWQIVPQRPLRAQGGFTQLSFPLSRLFDANPAGRNAGWTIAFTYGTDQVKARDIRAMTAIGAINGTGATGGLLANGWVANANGTRDRSDMAVATLVWKFNQYVSFNYESSVYLTHSTCIGGNGASTGVITASFDGASCAGTLFRANPARYWHDWRNEFGPIFTF